MINLIKNEVFKIFHKKSFYITIIIIIGLVGLINFAQSISDQNNTAFYDNIQIEEINRKIKELDPNSEKDREAYISYKTDKVIYDLNKQYGKDSWQAYILDHYGFAICQNYIRAEVTKSSDLAVAKEEYEKFVNKLANGSWEEYAQSDLEIAKKGIASLENTIKNTISSQELKELNIALEIGKVNKEVIEYRLNKKIPYGKNDLSKVLSSYKETKNIIIRYSNKDNLNDIEKRELQTSKKQAALAKYSLDKGYDVKSDTKNPSYLFQTSNDAFFFFFVIIAIVLGGSVVSEEFSKGTIKNLLIRPYRRWKILLSKYLSVLITTFIAIFIIMIFQFIFGGIFQGGFGNYKSMTVIYNYNQDKVMEMHFVISYLVELLRYLPHLLLSITLAFFVSTCFTSTIAAITFAIMAEFFASIINIMIEHYKISFLSFFPTLNWELGESLFGGPSLSKYTNLGQSIGLSLLYFIIMLLISFIVFKKKDIRNI